MAITVNTTSGNSLTVTVSGTTQASFTTETTSVSVTPPASSSVSILQKGPKGDTGAAGPTGQTGAQGPAGNSPNAFTTIAVAGQDNVVADATDDTLTIAAGSNVTVTTSAPSDTITISSTDTNTQLTAEQVQDIVGTMLTGNTETRISVTYEDSDGTIDFVVDDMTADTNTSLADTDQTLTAGRTINVDSNDLFIKDGNSIKLQFDASADEFLFTAPVRFDGGNAGGFIKLRETVQGGTDGVILRAPSGGMSGDVEFRLPGQDGSSGQFMRTDGSGNLSFSVPTDTNTSLSDTDQTLAAARTVNMNGNDLNFKDGATSKLLYDDSADEWVFNTAVRFDQSTTGGEIKLRESVMGGDSGVILRAPSSNLASDVVFRMPAADGSAGQFIKTDGSGNLSFGAAGGGTTLTQVYSQSFLDNIGTTKHYLPFKDINEQTTIYQEEAAMLMPFDGKVRSVSFRLPAITGTSGNVTIGVHTINTGNTGLFGSANWTDEETEVVAVAGTDDHATVHFVFDNAQHFEAGDLLSISIQCSTSLFGGSKYVYVSTILDYDTSNTMPSSSQVLSSNP